MKISAILRDRVASRYKVEDLVHAQDEDLVVRALKCLVLEGRLPLLTLSPRLRKRIVCYFRRKKHLLMINHQGILCVGKGGNGATNDFENNYLVVMPQLYQAELLYRAHDEMGHQGINKVVSRIQTRHDWVGLQEAASKWVNCCPICQQQKNPVGRLRFELQNIVSSEPNELIQFDHVNVCQSGQGNKKILVIIDHFTKYAEAVPCTKDDLSAERTVQILLDKWFARHGTPSIAQSDSSAQFTA